MSTATPARGLPKTTAFTVPDSSIAAENLVMRGSKR